MSQSYRTETDSMGSLEVPLDALYGAQTQRAVENFPISGLAMPRFFIRALGLVKAACADANLELGQLDTPSASAIRDAALSVAEGEHDAHFPVDVFQTGSGTSTNMNANEVIAHLASTEDLRIHPNDHVNKGQSSNDVIPTALHVGAALAATEVLLPALEHLVATLQARAEELNGITKSGRTHLMDAMPVRFDQELNAWARQLEMDAARIRSALADIYKLAQGGTAVGTGINAHANFGPTVAQKLSLYTRLPFTAADNYFVGLSSVDAAVALSGQLKTTAVSLMKIANDLRWMNSGPLAGLGEIQLPALQPGSSIMPGKVNPVIPESVAMVCAQVIGNDTTISIAGQSGNFQLNVMLPVTAYNLLQSIELLGNASRVLADKAVHGFRVNLEAVQKPLSYNPILVTALNNVIGYERGAAIAKQAYAEQRPILDVAAEMTDLSREQLAELLNPERLTK